LKTLTRKVILMELKQLTSPSLISVGIECRSKEEVIR